MNMNPQHQHDMFTALRTPAHRSSSQPLNRQISRHFDASNYGQLPGGLYTADDHAARYDAPRYTDRLNATIHGGYGGYDMAGAQSWNAAGFGHNSSAGLGTGARFKPLARGRNPIPNTWLDPPQTLPTMTPFHGFGSSALSGPPMRSDTIGSDPDEELIPTAIVIKNIPFAVKKEQLMDIMTHLQLPLPYAFNYHFDNGVFRGLAFANFSSAEETAIVIDAMNHFELQGRKLRVEYKKMLPLVERERIEREKRERRGQLEEQHRPMVALQLQTQPSISSMSSHLRAVSPSLLAGRTSTIPDLDFNDPQTLEFYSQCLLFRDDHSRDYLSFPPTLTPQQRRMIHVIAHQLNLAHVSKGDGNQRQLYVYRQTSPPVPHLPVSLHGDSQRRGLNRSATTDFSDVRASDMNMFGNVGHKTSGFLGNFPESSGSLAVGQNLRAAKSFADLRSFTPSPVPSTASFPANLGASVARFADYGQGNPSSTIPSLTPTANTMPTNDEGVLINGLGSMNLGTGFGAPSGSPRRLRGITSWEHEHGPIGGHRSVSTNLDNGSRDPSRAGISSRQTRGPTADTGANFSRPRQNGHRKRGSDELSSPSGVEIVVE